MIYSYGSMASINPIRYRGYYYDSETGFYYLQNRYYDPSICRFINADAAEYSELDECSTDDANLFAYCNNNPVNYSDFTGDIASLAVRVVLGAAISAGTYALTSMITGQEIEFENVVGSAVVGATSALCIEVRICALFFAGAASYRAAANGGASTGASIGMGVSTMAATALSIGNIDKIDIVAATVGDAVFSFGSSLVTSAGSSFISSAKSSGLAATKKTQTLSSARKKNQRKQRKAKSYLSNKKSTKSIGKSISKKTSLFSRLKTRLLKFKRPIWKRK